jgi:hypothetical protein
MRARGVGFQKQRGIQRGQRLGQPALQPTYFAHVGLHWHVDRAGELHGKFCQARGFV